MSIQGNKISLNSSGIVRSIDDTEVAKKHPYLCVKQGGSGNSKFVEIVVKTTDEFDTRLLRGYYILHMDENTIETFNLAEDITNTLSEIINNSFQITNDEYNSKVFLVKTNVATFGIYDGIQITEINQFINTSAKYINSNYNHTCPVGTIASMDMRLGATGIDVSSYRNYYALFIPNFTYDYVQETCDIIPGNDLINTLSIFLCNIFINSYANMTFNRNNELFRIYIELI